MSDKDDMAITTDQSISGEAPEKMLAQSQVNEIVKREKHRAAEKARLEAEEMHRQELERLKSESPRSSGSTEVDQIEQAVYQKLMTKLQPEQKRLQDEHLAGEVQKKVDQYYLKMGKGSELFNDFNEMMKDFRHESFPNAVWLATEMENTPEIMYELVKNPSKLIEIDELAQRSPDLARRQLGKLSDSIKTNLDAKLNTQLAPEPLSRIKSSTVGADNGKKTVRDLRQSPYLKA